MVARRNFLRLIFLVLLMQISCAHRIPRLKFHPEELPKATVGEEYHIRIFISNDVTPVYSIVATADEFPKELIWSYNKYDSFAELKGIPEVSGEFEFTVTATCVGTNQKGQSAMKKYILNVLKK